MSRTAIARLLVAYVTNTALENSEQRLVFRMGYVCGWNREGCFFLVKLEARPRNRPNKSLL